MINEKIKKLIYTLLLAINLYLLFLIIPKLSNLFNGIISIILPFIIAFSIAFILHPFVLFIQKYTKKKWIAVGIVLLMLIIVLFIFFKYTLSILINELQMLSSNIPELIKKLETMINDFFLKVPFLENYKISLQDIIDKFFDKNNNVIQETIFSNETFSLILNIGKYIIITPIILIYLLLDYEKIISSFRDYLIKNEKIKFKDYLGELNKTISSYFRGMLLVMLILFLVFSITFMILGIENGMIFAFIIAITNAIPYLGSWIGTLFPVTYVLLTTPNKTLLVLIICIIIQILEADVLTPLVQGKKTKLHPLIIVLSLMVFGVIFGFFGMIIAVPLSAIISITLKYYPIKIFKTTKKE